jgi:sulfoxide reductase catalytic subunit YedY
MLLRKTPDLTYADVTPRAVYLNRRKFLKAMGLAGAAAAAGEGLWKLGSPSQIVHATTKLTGVVKGPYSTDEKPTPLQRRHPLQQFLRIRHRKDRSRQKRGKI